MADPTKPHVVGKSWLPALDRGGELPTLAQGRALTLSISTRLVAAI